MLCLLCYVCFVSFFLINFKKKLVVELHSNS
jgi:hypothetical protein